jgi:hypothetical protein
MNTLCHVHATAAQLSDRDLLRRIDIFARNERHATVELLAHLAELDVRKLYLAEGYASLFSYCADRLRLSEHATYNRIEAARASRTFPVLLDLLATGALNLSTLRLLVPHLTPENHESVLAEASGRSKRDVEALVARLAPRPDLPASVRKLPVRMVAPARECPSATAPPAEAAFADSAPMTTRVPAAPRPVVAALAPERYRVQFTVSRETQEKLRRVQDLLRREVPDGDPAAIFDRALTLLLDDVARKKLAATSRPRPAVPADPRSRYVPAAVKRTVWARDGGRCAFVGRTGRRCEQRSFLEFHHLDPYARGGQTTVDNLALRCRSHNVHEAQLVLGVGRPTRPGASPRNGHVTEGAGPSAVFPASP